MEHGWYYVMVCSAQKEPVHANLRTLIEVKTLLQGYSRETYPVYYLIIMLTPVIHSRLVDPGQRFDTVVDTPCFRKSWTYM